MPSYQELQDQMERLKNEMATVRKAEISEAVSKIKEMIQLYQLTPADLGFRGLGKGSKAFGASAAKSVAEPKYRDPKSGKTWTGRGKPPLWIAGAKNRDAFLIEVQEEKAAAKAAAKAAQKAAAPAPAVSKKRSGKRTAAKKTAEAAQA